MKKLLLLLLLPTLTQAQILQPETPAPLLTHLVEINRQWLTQSTGEPGDTPVAFSSDRHRIRQHLQLVEQALRQRDRSDLGEVQRKLRHRHLNVLQDYWQTGVFPSNTGHPSRQPYFRDDYGVLCAVGYLLWRDGQFDLVERIRRENNFAYIAELAAQYPEIEAWAAANGFSQAELAWIQPGYEPIKPAISAWGNGGGLNAGGRINAIVADDADTRLFVGGRFSQIDGKPSNNIALWNGGGWESLGAGVDGEIFAMDYLKTFNGEKLFVAGKFSLPGQSQQQNVAAYDLKTKTWEGLQTGDMQGTVYTLDAAWNLCIGGDFKKVNGAAAQNLALYDFYFQDWNHYPQQQGFQTDGPVYDLERIDDRILVGGAFQHVFNLNTGSWEAAQNLAYHMPGTGDWNLLGHDLPPVHSLAFFKGNVFTGHQLSATNENIGMHVLKAGFWTEAFCAPKGDGRVHGFLPLNDRLYAFGGFIGGGLNNGSGAVYFPKETTGANGYLLADSTVRAMAFFQNHMYLAGDFLHLFDDAYPGMARVQTPSVAVTDPNAALPVQVMASTGELRLQYQDLAQATQFRLFDLQGRLLAEENLEQRSGELVLDMPLPNGLYVWQVQNTSTSVAGKWNLHR